MAMTLEILFFSTSGKIQSQKKRQQQQTNKQIAHHLPHWDDPTDALDELLEAETFSENL